MMNRFVMTTLVLLALGIVFMPVAAPVVWTPFTLGFVPTGSMVPAINVGDVIFVDRTASSSDVAVGDIIMFCCSGIQPVSHRVVESDGNKIVAKGDANSYNDYLTKDDYLGKVSFVIKSSMLGPLSFTGILLTPSGMFFSAVLVLLIRRYRSKNSSKSRS